MFFKEIFSLILAPIVLVFNLVFGTPSTEIYIAPDLPKATTTIKTSLGTTTKKTIVATTTIKNKPFATSTKIKTVVKPPMQAITTPVVVEPTPNFELINSFVREATVNIFCSTKGGGISPISGTGIIVKPDGLILTNAHIGQYLLLKDFREPNFVECLIRTGSPATNKYNAELVYISPTWVANNKTILKQENPKGTGENDFAFLRITKMIDNSKLPPNLSFIKMNTREFINEKETVLLASYPAGFLGSISIIKNLNLTSAITTIQELLTFKTGTIDIISVPGTVISQKGSSGGAVVDKYATLIGIIVTSSEGETTSIRGLNAITIAYINRELQKELDITLEQFVNQDSALFAKKFQEINAPALTKLITDELTK